MAYNLLFDGFEDYSTYQDLNLFGYYTADSWGDQLVSVLSTAGRRGGACVKIATAYSGGLIFSIAPSTHVVLGLALKMNQTGFYTGPMAIEFLGGGLAHAQLVLQENTTYGLNVGGAYAGSSSELLPKNTWVYVELGLAVANSNGSYEVRVNGTAAGYISGTGDTQNGSATTIDQIKIIGLGGGGVQHQIYVDDMRVTYGNEVVWMGDMRVDPVLLTGNSTPQDWTPSTGNAWERLNTGDGYVYAETQDAISLFTVAELPHQPDTIHGVCVRSLHLKDTSGSREVATLVKSSGTMAESANLSLELTNKGLTQFLKTDPATNGAWTLPAITALTAGMKVKI